MIMIIPASLDY